ncbi:MAG: serine/threonine-protein kinase, partial [Lysobacterales bacterium]
MKTTGAAPDDATLQRALSIFRELVELPECERVAWFEARCGHDEELRTTVERLLAADSAPAGPLDDRAALFVEADTPTLESARFANTEVAAGPRQDNEARIGQHVGAYRLVQLLGHGGMGAVYLAERNAGGFTQQVALKLIRSGYEGSDARRRFERERQILSRLQHPAIARLYDGGVLEDGSPWFAMELIEGEGLSQWCAHWAVSVRDRVALLLRIAEAVQYAHQQLVIHRDLKPSNIMIDRDGAPHVLDFGIAALLDEQPQDDSTPNTFIHTPEYAAPEQIRGDPHSAATDVFTLGIMLCELLVGTRPFQQPGATPFAMQRAVLERDAPSLGALLPTDSGVLATFASQRGTSGPQLRRQLSGDLDLIVHKALEKRPQDRYASVAAMAEDLRRHLEGRAVLAVPPRFGYRAGKFLRRHRIPIAAAVAIFAVLVIATGVSLAQAQAARQQAERAEAVKQFIVSLFQQTRPEESDGKPITAKSLLDDGSKRIAE